MRLYVHTRNVTYIWKGTGSEKLESLLSDFVKAAASITGLTDPGVLTAALPSGKALAASDPVNKFFQDRDDVSVVVPAGTPPPKAVQKAPAAKPKSEVPPTGRRPAAAEIEESVRVITDLLSNAAIAVRNKNFAQAKRIYTEILRVVPPESPHGLDCLDKLAIMAEGLRQWDSAADHLGKMVSATKGPPSGEDPSLYVRLGTALKHKGDLPGSVEAYERALKRVRGGGGAGTGSPPLTVNRIKALMSEPLYQLGARDAAVTLVMQVVGEEPNLPEGLLQYSRIALDRGLLQDAIRSLLRLLAAQSTNAECKQLLAKSLKQPDGLRLLRLELSSGGAGKAALAPALAFVATSVKEHGAAEEAAEILGEIAETLPESAGHALGHCHALETIGRPLEALRALERFLKRVSAVRLGPLVVGDFAALLALPADLAAAEKKQLRTRTPWDGRALSGVDLTDAEVAPPAAAAAAAAVAARAGGASLQYSSEQLDLLACVFTAVKLLYSFGLFRRSVALAAFAEAAKMATQVELHTTHIRNEHAFFLFLSAILSKHPVTPEERALAAPLASGGDAAAQPVYLIGDSHCFAAAWRGAEPGPGRAGWFAPLLVTGCKAWHLRPEETFYTKSNFFAAVGRVPKGAKVVVLFGEIDCREGLLISVQKGRYRDLQEAIDATVQIYLACLLRLITEHNFEIFVHPVPPVLDVTRPVVVPYTERLKLATVAAAASPAARGRLHWLDFFDALLTGSPEDGDKRSLKPEFVLDGTHLAPTYVSELKQALSSAAAPTPAVVASPPSSSA